MCASLRMIAPNAKRKSSPKKTIVACSALMVLRNAPPCSECRKSGNVFPPFLLFSFCLLPIAHCLFVFLFGRAPSQSVRVGLSPLALRPFVEVLETRAGELKQMAQSLTQTTINHRTYARMSFRPKGEISLWDVEIILGETSSRVTREFKKKKSVNLWLIVVSCVSPKFLFLQNYCSMKQKSIWRVVFLFIAVLVCYYSCTKDKGFVSITDYRMCDSLNIKYSSDIQPIIQTYCATSSSCHGAGASDNYTTYEAVKTKVDDRSFRKRVLYGDPSFMPPSGMMPKLMLQKIDCWLKDGAPNN